VKSAKRAERLIEMLDEAGPQVRILSLDCFDTLLWRNTHAPIDVFTAFDMPGGALMARRFAEDHARSARKQLDGSDEVAIEEIARYMLPGDPAPAEVAALVDRELAAEAHHCYAFAPIVALIRAAKARGLEVIIVSDTYLSEPQLRALIAAAAGDDVAALIDRIFCSSEHGLAKAQGLFERVLRALEARPETILHVGDNASADLHPPAALGIHAVHFEQFDEAVSQQLRFEAASAAMIDPAVRISVPAFQPHRAALSLRRDGDGAGNAATLLGHDVFGPMMLGFARWVRAEAQALAAATGRPVKPLFLLRDGYLPQRMYEAAGFGAAGAIELSRFTARRASFTDEAAIRRYLAEEPTHQVDVLGRQLLLEDAEIARLGRRNADFRKTVVAPAWIARIVARSAAFADRLAAHVRAQGVEAGDQLMLVDLGYNGSVQNLAEDVLASRLGVAVCGRYLLLRETRASGRDKKGLIDARHYDHRVLGGLARQVATLEQLSTAPQASVVDYGADGVAVRKRGDIKATQSAVREAVQQACLAYPATAARAKHRPAGSDDADCERTAVAAILARLLFLPRAQEIELLQAFDHDVNLGTDELVKLIDDEAADAGLRTRGLGYLAGVERMYVSGELQRHGLPLTLSLFTIGRLQVDLRQADFQAGGLDVPVLIVAGNDSLVTAHKAYPTHDGFYLLTVPLKARSFAAGIQFGQIAEILQIASIGVHPAKAFAEASSDLATIPAQTLLDGMERLADGLHRCSEQGLLFVPPVQTMTDEPLVLAVAFRPVVRRAVAMELRQTA
jgi:FMN phosphatase YigB (HAD superfamily)